ncbi:hypothetical protein [Limnochorda pilosa]|uniref:Uncharacterized protein n=1 Tax=Limnochorda pilosa TaxID=1555112 RepID=A0A0K2SG48_LIMPI|nr:hypothetical protein [Limnochorda pilosa]BAS26076.1 hypothetical protein LIP_0219 [Limnochorda pilosa]
MRWIGCLVWAGVSLYGSYLIGRELLAVLRRRELLDAFGERRSALTWLRIELGGVWLASSAAWTLLLALTPPVSLYSIF